jgi:hypothetical protein
MTEIATFIRYRPTWRGLVLVVLLVVLAGGSAGYLTYRKPLTYRAVATVFIRSILSPDTPDYLLRPVADDYQSGLDLPSVTRAAARASGLPEGSISGQVGSERISATANVRVSFESTNRGGATKVVRAVAHQALVELASRELDGANSALNKATQDRAAAVAALAKYRSSGGNDNAQIQAYQGTVDHTTADLNGARDTVDRFQFELEAAKTVDAVVVGTPTALSRRPDTIRAGATAAIIATMVGLALLVIVDRRKKPEIHWAAPNPVSSIETYATRG